MTSDLLHVVLRTPQKIVWESDVASLRLPTASGQVGLRPRCEATVLAVEPGLVILRTGETYNYAGTAGGLLRCDGQTATLLTPLAVVGDDMAKVLEQLDQSLAAPSAEKEFRTMLKRLEQNILEELQHGGSDRAHSTGAQR